MQCQRNSSMGNGQGLSRGLELSSKRHIQQTREDRPMATIATTEQKSDATQSLGSVPHWIGGKAVGGQSKSFADVFNPATGEVKRRVPLDGTVELEQAVAAATAAFPEWSSLPPLRRARVLFRFRDLLEKNTERLAAVITSEHGTV